MARNTDGTVDVASTVGEVVGANTTEADFRNGMRDVIQNIGNNAVLDADNTFEGDNSFTKAITAPSITGTAGGLTSPITIAFSGANIDDTGDIELSTAATTTIDLTITGATDLAVTAFSSNRTFSDGLTIASGKSITFDEGTDKVLTSSNVLLSDEVEEITAIWNFTAIPTINDENIATASTVVALTGAQDIAGGKTFEATVVGEMGFTGDLSGNVTGDVTGDVEGNIDADQIIVDTGSDDTDHEGTPPGSSKGLFLINRVSTSASDGNDGRLENFEGGLRFNGAAIGGSVATVLTQGSLPDSEDTALGNLWYDTADGVLSVYDTGAEAPGDDATGAWVGIGPFAPTVTTTSGGIGGLPSIGSISNTVDVLEGDTVHVECVGGAGGGGTGTSNSTGGKGGNGAIVYAIFTMKSAGTLTGTANAPGGLGKGFGTGAGNTGTAGAITFTPTDGSSTAFVSAGPGVGGSGSSTATVGAHGTGTVTTNDTHWEIVDSVTIAGGSDGSLNQRLNLPYTNATTRHAEGGAGGPEDSGSSQPGGRGYTKAWK